MDSAELATYIQKIQDEQDFFHKAKLIRFLQKDKQIPLKRISELLHMKPAYVCHVLRLNRLPEIIVDGYYSQLVSISHLFVIARIKDPAKMVEVYEKVLSTNATVLQTEAFTREALYQVTTKGDPLKTDEKDQLSEILKHGNSNISVHILQTRIKAKITIEIRGSLESTSQTMREMVKRLSNGSGTLPIEETPEEGS